MPGRSQQRRTLSRSKLELFVECPRCFYLDVARGVRRPSGPPFTLNNAVDRLFKAEFDRYRAAARPHPLFERAGLDAVPFGHPELDGWRENFKGLRFTDEASGWSLSGAIDDLWQASSGELIVADYKATARREPPTPGGLYPSYRRQMEVYQFLVRRQGFEVSERGWFVYANGDASAGEFGDALRFTTYMIPYDGNDGWVLGAFRQAIDLVGGSSVPGPGEDCAYCAYVERAGRERG